MPSRASLLDVVPWRPTAIVRGRSCSLVADSEDTVTISRCVSSDLAMLSATMLMLVSHAHGHSNFAADTRTVPLCGQWVCHVTARTCTAS